MFIGERYFREIVEGHVLIDAQPVPESTRHAGRSAGSGASEVSSCSSACEDLSTVAIAPQEDRVGAPQGLMKPRGRTAIIIGSGCSFGVWVPLVFMQHLAKTVDVYVQAVQRGSCERAWAQPVWLVVQEVPKDYVGSFILSYFIE